RYQEPHYSLTCPSPTTTNFVVVSSRAPTGPRAWTREVEIPISAPMPNCPPSTSRVDALTRTTAASTSRVKRRAWPRSLVTIASARPVPWRRMCSIAASRSSTTRIARIRSRYSVSQSASVAGLADGTGASVPGQPRSSTLASARRTAREGRSRGAISRCTSRVSRALQTLGRCAFAFSTICAAIAGSAEASTNTCTTPLSCLSTGMRERSATQRTNSSPPRGMIRSTRSSSSRSTATASRSVVSMNWIASAGPPAFSTALASTAAIIVFDSIASLPPRRTTALPDLPHRPAASAVTFGREQRRGLLDEPVRHLPERVVLELRRAERERARGIPGGAGLGFHELADVHGHSHSPLEDHEVVAVDHLVEAPVTQPSLDLRCL